MHSTWQQSLVCWYFHEKLIWALNSVDLCFRILFSHWQSISGTFLWKGNNSLMAQLVINVCVDIHLGVLSIWFLDCRIVKHPDSPYSWWTCSLLSLLSCCRYTIQYQSTPWNRSHLRKFLLILLLFECDCFKTRDSFI